MQVNINPINNTYKPAFCAKNTSQIVKLTSNSYEKVVTLREVCKDVFSKLRIDEELIQKAVSKFENIKLTKNSIQFLLENKESVRLLMPLGFESGLLVLQNFKNEELVKTAIVNNNSFLQESIRSKDEEIKSSSWFDGANIENFISKIHDNADFPLLKLRIFLQKEFEKNNPTVVNPYPIYSEIIRKNNENTQIQKEKLNDTVLEALKEKNVSERVIPSVGFVGEELQAKLKEIKSLYIDCRKFLDEKSLSTVVKICNGYPSLTRRDSKGFSFKDIKIIFPDSPRVEEEFITIKNLEDKFFVHMTLTGKIINNNEEKLNIGRFFKNPKYLSEKDIEQKLQEKNLIDTIDKTLINLKEFKSYIDNQGWRVRKNKEILAQNYGFINEELQEKIKLVKTKYDYINRILKSMSYYNSSKIKSSFGGIVTVATSRLEFINPLKDDLNLAFDFSTNKYGEFYKIARYSGGNNVENLYLVTPDGKIVKNAVKNQGLKSPFPTGGQADVKFYSEEELNSFDLKGLEQILDNLIEKSTEYEKFIIDWQEMSKLKKEKTVLNNEKQALVEKEFSYNTVKEFLNQTAKELQSKADMLAEGTSYKTAIDSIAKDLKSKFDDFLKQFKN